MLLAVSAFAGVPAAAASKVSASKVAMGAKDTPKGKGGIFPWIKNEPGTYAEVAMLSSFDFTGDDGDKLIGWGFMPKSVKALYTGKTRTNRSAPKKKRK